MSGKKAQLFQNMQEAVAFGENLVFELRKPFDLFVKGANHPDWLGLVGKLRTSRAGEIRIFREVFTSSNNQELILRVA